MLSLSGHTEQNGGHMKKRRGEFLCNICETSVFSDVQIAENENEFERLRNTIQPIFAESNEPKKILKQFKCTNEACSGEINVICVEMDPSVDSN
jgi:hypothetical protein